VTLATTPSPDIDRALGARRAIEALRSGVPSAHAVALLGSLQPDIDARFEQLCQHVRDLPGSGRPAGGLLVGGGFGTGKSHLLAHLTAVADRQGFVTSAVTVSKEVPLHDLTRVGKAIIGHGTVDGAAGDVIERLAENINIASPGWAELRRHTHAGTRLDSRFAATVALFGRPGTPEELNEHLVRFWAGEPLHLPTVRRALKALGLADSYQFERISERDLWTQRIGFIARLARAAGHPGWIVTFDEAELIGRYPTRQRARSYAELGRWLRRRSPDPTAPLAAVVAITDDYEAAILDGKDDRHLPARLRARQGADDEITAGAAETGLRAIQRDLLTLKQPEQDDLDTIQDHLRALHDTAYTWQSPPAPGLPPRTTTRLRQHIRAWINQWDLYRLDPTRQLEIQTHAITTNWDEDADLSG
jgi:hypothetical protein